MQRETGDLPETMQKVCGYDAQTGRLLVDVNPEFYRPAEVEFLWGNAAKAEKELGWKRKIDFKNLVAMMMDSDLKEIAGMSTEEYRNRQNNIKRCQSC